MLSQLPHQHRSLLPQPPPPPPPLPPHARSDLSKCRARVNTARGADLALFPVFDQYLPVAPLAPTQFSHAVLPQSVRAHLNLHLRASWLARGTTFAAKRYEKHWSPLAFSTSSNLAKAGLLPLPTCTCTCASTLSTFAFQQAADDSCFNHQQLENESQMLTLRSLYVRSFRR